MPLTCVPATWDDPPEQVLGCAEAALVARGAVGAGPPPLAAIRFQHGPRCESGLTEEVIEHLPPDLQAEERRRRDAPCPELEPDLGLVRLTFQPVAGRVLPESYVEVELGADGVVRATSDLRPWCEPPLDCGRPDRP